MAINTSKTQVVHFRRTNIPKTNSAFYFGDSLLETVSFYKYLGVIFDEHLSFDKNATVLADAACRALGAIRVKLKNLKSCGYNTFNTLFNSGVLSISDYSAAIWGTKTFAKTEQVSYKAARFFMGVHRFASVDALLGDMGWSSARSRHKILLLKYWKRLCDLPDDRLTRRVFHWDRQFANLKGTWSYAVRQVLNEIECPEYFCNVSSCDVDYAKSIISHQMETS